MVKKFNVKISDTEDYIRTLNGIFELSPTEIRILSQFVDIYTSLRNSSVNINPFSTEMKKKVAKQLGRDNFNTLNNYIKNLCNKKAISKSVDGYDIHPLLIPANEEGILFKLDYQNGQ